MSPTERPSRTELMDEAALWLAKLDSGTATPEAFEAWRNADPRRAAAFAQVANAARTLDRTKPVLKGTQLFPAGPGRRNLLVAALTIGTVAATAGAAAIYFGNGRASATTSVGGRRSVTLPNGAHLELNTNSKAEWRAGEGRVEIWLKGGEVALQVASRAQACTIRFRDSIVEIDQGTVNARLRGDMLDLTVLAGRCFVTAGGGDRKVIQPHLISEREAILTGGGEPVVRPVDPADAHLISAWPSGELVFQGQTLETAVNEYNRYLRDKIIIADPSIASTKIGGRFTTQDSKVFLLALHSSFGITASVDANGTTVLTK